MSSEQDRVIAVGVHPDDLIYGMGGTITYFRQRRITVICIVLTRGERGGPPDVREQECIRGLGLLSVPKEHIHIAGFPDCGVRDDHGTIAYLEHFVGPDVFAAFFPSSHDTHPDHRRAHDACVSAFRDVPPRLLAYETPSRTAEFSPTACIEITDYMDAKWRALQCHASQREKMYLRYDAVMHRAADRGSLHGVPRAEAFEIIRYRIEPPLVRPGRKQTDEIAFPLSACPSPAAAGKHATEQL